ncbi:MAG: coenzyme F420-0:L-glutamate ligase [Actinobacteria bacterium]|nr:coenzyme F420-0:L-glutamate ligase [Actinomycetota bacterium]
MTVRLVLTALSGLPLIRPGDDLVDLVRRGLEREAIALEPGDVIVLAQKVVSKAEGRLVNLAEVLPSEAAVRLASEVGKDPRLVEVILSESRGVLRTRPGMIIVEHRLGFICANAGVDHSNVRGEGGQAEDWVLMLPADPDASARLFRQRLGQETGVEIGTLIIDSHGRAWRKGTVGVAIGVAGFPALVDLRGRPDLFGYRLQSSEVGLADEIAAAASALMGQADESRPVIHVRGVPYPLRDGSLSELLRPTKEDLFR